MQTEIGYFSALGIEIGSRVMATYFDREIGKDVNEIGTVVEWRVVGRIATTQALVEFDNGDVGEHAGYPTWARFSDKITNMTYMVFPISKLNKIN